MVRVQDAWFVRLPNGREVRAKTTKAVIYHLRNGIIPRNSHVRRSREDEWAPIEWTAEFAEVVSGKPKAKSMNGSTGSSPDLSVLAGVASRIDPMRLKTVGVRGLWDDLIAALDTTFCRNKILVTIVAAAAAAMLLTPAWQTWLIDSLRVASPWPARGVVIVASLLALTVLSWASGLVVRISYVELSHMRPARWREATQGYLPHGLRLTAVNLLVIGTALTMMWLLRALPAEAEALALERAVPAFVIDIGREAISAVGLLLEIGLWFVIGTAWLLTPLVTAEELPIHKALREWSLLLRGNLRRIMMAEAMALGLGVLIALPFAVPVWLAATHYQPPLGFLSVLLGASLAPLVTFLAVANVFIYLDVRYEQQS